jgi:hypothetical protein
MNEPRITRAALQKITEDLIDKYDIAGGAADDLRQVALTAEYVLASGWYATSVNCGCLVGSAYPDIFRDFGIDTPGMKAADVLNEALGYETARKVFEAGVSFASVIQGWLAEHDEMRHFSLSGEPCRVAVV